MMSKVKGEESRGMTCPRCTETATKVCAGCKNISYCSAECQQADWSAHKLLCKTLKDFTRPPASSHNLRRAIAFLPDEQKPLFKWVPVKRELAYYDANGHPHFWEGIDKTTVTDNLEVCTARDIITNAWNGEPLGYDIQVVFDENFKTKYAGKNKAVAAATQGMDDVGWRGPIIAYCGTLRGGDFDALDIVKVHDMDMRAYSHLVAYLIDHYNHTVQHKLRKGPKVECVKVADSIDRENSALFQKVLVPPSHPMFSGQSVLSGVSKQLQEPLITWQCPRTSSKAARGPSNPEIVSLHVCCNLVANAGDDSDIDAESFGYPHKLLLLDVGTHIVAKTSGKPLDCELVEAMVDFCRFHLPPFFQRCAESEDFEDKEEDADPHLEDLDEKSPSRPSRIELRQKVMDEITPRKFETYLAQWKDENADKIAKEFCGELVYTEEKARSGVERMGLTEQDSERLINILFNFNNIDQELRKLNFEGLKFGE